MKKLICLLVIVMMVSGCATTGKFSRLSLDMTKEEVVKALGKPAVVRNVEKSPDEKHTREIWEYMEYKTGDAAFYGLPTQYWVVIEDGKLARWGEPFDVGARATPTGKYQFEWSDMGSMRREDIQMAMEMQKKIDDFMSQNKQNLMKVSLGMTKQEVSEIMGTKTARASFETISNPYKIETVRKEDKTFEVIYYYTDTKAQDGVVADDELTPLIFDNNKLVGTGHSFLEEIKK